MHAVGEAVNTLGDWRELQTKDSCGIGAGPVAWSGHARLMLLPDHELFQRASPAGTMAADDRRTGV